ncbi:putative aldo/keto reductase [Lasiosphaeria miniovina]|uniref:Aldo/keto reductase n=1 Tax=Lasiosphaeria miniovina TaxID=1954250 RepID=A0AA39ZR63_9PEZI|nr:putative aldo/keto reductase [Lasiosphaeria miniovina]KAK0701955.1 putative aldo/keto reductase [Lasiosphaeria miniovina]
MTTTIAGKTVSQNGLGLMRFTEHEAAMPDEETFAVLKAAVAAGVTLWSAADFYGTPESNSLHLLARYFAKYPEDGDKVVVCIKSGVVDMKKLLIDGSAAGVRRWVASANAILGGVKKIDVFGIARVDKKVPIEETVGALAELVAQGAIGGIQLSEAGPATIRRAAATAKIDLVEEEVSLWSTDVFSKGIAAACAELAIPIVAHSPLGAGMLTGRIKSLDDLPKGHYPRVFPKFRPGNFEKNLELVRELEKFARAKGASLPQLTLSWVRAQSSRPGVPFIIPIAGARSANRIKENLAAVDLSGPDLKAIDDILACFPVYGTRYPEAGMALVDF